MKVFVDSNFYLAVLLPRDQWQSAAARAVRPGLQFVTSSLVINESLTRLQRRGLFSTALEFLQKVQTTDELQIVHPDVPLQTEAWDLFGTWGSSGASAVDCMSFAIMKRFGIRKAFTFDSHFHKAGFEILKK